MGALSSLGRTNAEVDFPYMTSVDGQRFITNIKQDTLIGYKYIQLKETGHICLVYRGTGEGNFEVRTKRDGEGKAIIRLTPSPFWTTAMVETDFSDEDLELYLVYRGEGSQELLALNLLA